MLRCMIDPYIRTYIQTDSLSLQRHCKILDEYLRVRRFPQPVLFHHLVIGQPLWQNFSVFATAIILLALALAMQTFVEMTAPLDEVRVDQCANNLGEV